jgi:hypothetical protein
MYDVSYVSDLTKGKNKELNCAHNLLLNVVVIELVYYFGISIFYFCFVNDCNSASV